MSKSAKKLPHILKIKSCLNYDPITGLFKWRERPLSHFNTRFAWAMWNDKYSGKTAGMASKLGYIIIKIDGQAYKAHRIAWKIMTMRDPVDVIDHINGIEHDNRIENLRDVSFDENMRNKKMSKANTSGVLGVHKCKNSGKWIAQISIKGGKSNIGSFHTITEAVIARKKSELDNDYHENHGRII